MATATTTVFTTNKTQAVRLAKAVAFPEGVREVTVRTIGASRIITPTNLSLAEWLRAGPFVSDGFPDRDPDFGLVATG